MYYLIPIITVFGFYNISLKIKDKLNINYDSFLFSLLLFLFTLVIFTNLIIFKISFQFSKNIIFILLIISTLDFIYNQSSEIILKIKKNKIIFAFYFIVAAISLIPLAGADSYAYHLAWPNDLILNPDVIFDKLNLEYRVVGNGEVVNYIGLFLGTENLQSFISISILFFLILEKDNKYLLFLLIISSPIFLKYSLDQKPFILPCLTLVIFSANFLKNINLNKIQNIDLLSFLLALVFFAGSKYPFLILGFIIAIFFLLLSIKYKFFKKFFLFGLLVFIIYFIPIPLIKFLEFGDPFSPFLEGMFNNSDYEILSLKKMYTSWDGLKIDDNGNIFLILRNIFNFIIPIAPFSILDTYGFGFLFLFFYRFRDKKNIALIVLLFFSTTFMVTLTNFQSRWYIFLILYVVLNHDYLGLSKKFENLLIKIMIPLATIIGCFYLFFLGFVILNTIHNNFEDTKNKTLYLYKDIKNIENISKGKLILTNTRSNFFSQNLIQYKYPKYSKNLILNNNKIHDIEYGFFSIGGKFTNKKELKNKSILANFYIDCYDIISFSNNLVAKRNLFSRKDYEQFVLIKFNKNIKNCFK